MKEDETVVEKAPPKKKEKETTLDAAMKPMIYIGPHCRARDLSTYKVFAEGIPKDLKDDPIHAPLFVSPEYLDAARIEVTRTGTRLHVLYQKAMQEQAEKKRS